MLFCYCKTLSRQSVYCTVERVAICRICSHCTCTYFLLFHAN